MKALNKKLVILLRANIDTLRGEVRGLRSVKSSELAAYPRPEGAPGSSTFDGRNNSVGIPIYICFFCRKGTHFRNSCPDLLKIISKELVYLNKDRKVYLRRYKIDIYKVRFPANRISSRDYIRYLLNLAK